MRKTGLLLIVLCSAAQLLWAITGTGTSDDPYQVSTASDLATIAGSSTYWASGVYIKQTADIDLTSYGSWTPIGTSTSSPFYGTYDGNGHKITGLTITSYASYGAGLFGYNRGTIKNLGVSGTVSSTNGYTGILAGANYYGTIQNCYTEGSVSTSSNSIGGFVGACMYSATGISQCYSTATVTATGTGSANVGGFVGTTNSTSGQTISECYCTGNVSNANDNSGGNKANTGGFVGASALTISNCYSTGNVTCGSGGERFGGFCGFASYNTPITNCYSTGSVTGTSLVKGGFVGYYNTGTFTGCYFDQDIANMSSYGGYATSAPTGITAATTSTMQTASTFTSAGWSTSYWSLVNGSYPQLIWALGDESLPVSLTSFIAEPSGNAVVLAWRTESETENLGFIIERQTVGAIHELPSEWSPIASYTTANALAGHGSTSEAHAYTYTDAAVVPGKTYAYRIADVDYRGTATWHNAVEITVTGSASAVLTVFGLQKAYPNPFNPSVTLSYALTDADQTTLSVYNLRGQLVETLVNAHQPGGSYNITWQPENLSAGIYLVRLESGNKTNLQKVVFVK